MKRIFLNKLFVAFVILAMTVSFLPGGMTPARAAVPPTISLTTLGLPYTQNFDTLAITGIANAFTLDGWQIDEAGGGARDNELYAADTGASNSGDTYSFGAAASTDRALGGLQSGTLIPTFGANFTNNTGSTVTTLAVSYTGEEWRLGTAARTDRIDFQYSFDASSLTTGTWTDVNALDFTTPNTALPINAKNGNDPANQTSVSSSITGLSIANGSTFWIRWTDFNASGSDDGLAVDSFAITPKSPSNISIDDVSHNEGDSGTTTFTFTVSLSAPAPAGGVSFDIGTADGTATAAEDYTAKSLTGQTIAEGNSSYSFDVLVNGDTKPEIDETFFVNLTNVTEANVTDGQGRGTIVNDEVAPSLTINDVSKSEGNSGATTFSFTVSLDMPAPAGGVPFDIATANGTAIEPGDYTANALTGQTIPEGSTTYTFDVSINGDTTVETNETFQVNITNTTNVIPTDTQGIGTIQNDDFVPIHDIQGSGATSPMTAQVVSIQGIVVGDYQGASPNLGGFYVQEKDATVDADPATSEGIFVYSNTPVSTGDLVSVTGTVAEYVTTSGGLTSSLSQISSVSEVNVVSSGNALPTAAVVTLPVSALTDWERYEGMLVAFEQDLSVTEVYSLGRYGQVDLSVNVRLSVPTNVVAPGALAIALEDLNTRSRIILDDASSASNPDPVIYPNPGLSASNTLRVGDSTQNLSGVLDERYGAYRIQPVGTVNFVASNPRPATPASVGGNLKVAGLNMLNYFVTLGAGYTCGPTSGLQCRGATNVAEFEHQREKLVNSIATLSPDVAGLMEMENDAADGAAQDLVNGLNTLLGAGTYAYIPTGPIGTDAIRLAIIYKPAVVTASGSFAVLTTAINPLFLDTKNRPTLAQTFALKTTGAKFTLVVNHLKSKGSACTDVGDPDTGDGQSNCNLTRTNAAMAITQWLATDPTSSGDADYLVVGDMNAYAQEDPITAFKSAGYENLIDSFLGADGYSYVFSGETGYLDHALANSTLAPQVTGVTEWHINADEPIALDYNTEFKSAGQIISYYSADPYRASDHDPVLVGIHLLATPTITFDPAPTPTFGGGNFTVSATTTNSDNTALTYSVDSGPCALVSDATFSSNGAGTCVVKATGAATTNFTEASQTLSVTIDKATPTATLAVNNSPVTYDGAAHSATVEITVSSVPGAVSNISTGGAASQTNADVYAVTADFVPTDSTNYKSLTGLSAGNFSIDKATPTATLAVNNSPVTYDGAAHSATVEITVSSVPGAVSNISTGGAASQTAANDYAVTADFVPTDSTNYKSLTGLSAGNFTINKATPVITFDPAPTPAFGGGNFTVSATTTNSDSTTLTYSVESGPCAWVSGATFSSSGAGTCVVKATGAATTNFTEASETLGVTIDKATPTATLAVSNSPVTYDGAAHSATVGITVSSVPGTVNNISTGGADSQTTADVYAVTADFVPTDATNYKSLTGLSAGNFSIDKATPTATLAVNNSPVTYDGAAHSATVGVTVSSVPGAVSNISTGGAASQTTADVYAVTADFVPTDSTNYKSLTGLSAGNFTINKATPVITFDPAPAPLFPGANFSVNATTTNTDSATLTYTWVSGPCAWVSGSTFSSSGTGVCVVQASGALSANFQAATQTQNVTIAAANNPPTNILLSASSVAENKPAGTLVGNLSATDPDAGDTAAFSLVSGVSGCAGTDNASFEISGTQFKTLAPFDFETKNGYLVCVRATDGHGGTYEKPFTIIVTNVVDEVAQNGSFEFFIAATKIPTNWVAANFGTLDGKNTAKKAGLYSVKISGATSKVKTLTQTLLIPTGAMNDKLTFSFWVKGDAIPTRPATKFCQAQVTLYYNDLVRLKTTVPCPTGTFNFVKKTVTLNPHEVYNKAVIKFTYSKTTGSVWFDLVSLMK